MQQQIGRIDHISFMYRLENLEAARQQFTDALGIDDWDGPKRFEKLGIMHTQSVLAGIELIAPLGDEGMFADRLRQHGEGLSGLVFGVADLDTAVSKAIANGAQVAVGADGVPITYDAMVSVDGQPPYESWSHKYNMYREVQLKPVAGVSILLGQIEPADSPAEG